MLTRRFGKLLLAACCFVGGAAARPASACECEVITTKKAKERAEAVFSGTVVESHREMSPDGEEWRIRLAVESYWKGDLAGEVIIYTTTDGCRSSFETGKKYLVFAVRQEGRGRLITDSCMRTGLLEGTSVEVEKLGKPKQPARGEGN